MLDSKPRGFSLIDALIGIVILSVGLIWFTKNWNANFSAKNSTNSRSVAATQAAEIGNVLLVHVSDLDKTTAPGLVQARVQSFSDSLANHLNSFARAKGYECIGNEPHALGAPDLSINLNSATLPRVWAQGAASCVSITTLPFVTTQTNGVWVKVQVHWIDAHTQVGQSESVSIHTLVSPTSGT